MPHKFDVNNKGKLDNPKRREMLPVNKILEVIGLQSGDNLADIGCGIGYISIPATNLVGDTGMVYALDVNTEMLDELDKRIVENKTDHIQTILSEEYNFNLDDNSVSQALICTVIHEVDDRIKFLNETKRILNSNGKIAVIEWIKKESDWGPPVSHRIDSGEVIEELQQCGFKELEYIQFNEYFYIVKGTLPIK
jgi:ubiquinone/menaquinone biosynthesis C-methylase UbiE